jgi:L-ascorbate metabolism protein UlaG (beta-lactamase superfamily)
MLDQLLWHGYASFSLLGTPHLLLDPSGLAYRGAPPDLILVSHEHYQHCSPADVNKLRGPQTRVIASQSAAPLLDGPVEVLRPWQTLNIGRTSIRALPAYTFDGQHPARREDLGFMISRNYMDIYFTGDTDYVPELRGLRCDIVVLPLPKRDASLSMSNALDLIRALRPRYVVPSHYKPEQRTNLDLNAFEREVAGLATLLKLSIGQKALTGALAG